MDVDEVGDTFSPGLCVFVCALEAKWLSCEGSFICGCARGCALALIPGHTRRTCCYCRTGTVTILSSAPMLFKQQLSPIWARIGTLLKRCGQTHSWRIPAWRNWNRKPVWRQWRSESLLWCSYTTETKQDLQWSITKILLLPHYTCRLLKFTLPFQRSICKEAFLTTCIVNTPGDNILFILLR